MSTSMADTLTYYDIDTLLRLVREAHRRASRAAARNRETGLVDTLPGRDADAVREVHLAKLMAKIEELRDEQVPDSFMQAPKPVDARDLMPVADPGMARIEDERDAAEALADSRGVLLAEMARVMSDELAGTERDVGDVLGRVREHLRVTGEVPDDD